MFVFQQINWWQWWWWKEIRCRWKTCDTSDIRIQSDKFPPADNQYPTLFRLLDNALTSFTSFNQTPSSSNSHVKTRCNCCRSAVRYSLQQLTVRESLLLPWNKSQRGFIVTFTLLASFYLRDQLQTLTCMQHTHFMTDKLTRSSHYPPRALNIVALMNEDCCKELLRRLCWQRPWTKVMKSNNILIITLTVHIQMDSIHVNLGDNDAIMFTVVAVIIL